MRFPLKLEGVLAFLREMWTVYDVRLTDAVGDGVTDDTAAIQAALSAVELAGGGEVYLPVGTYLISSTLLIGSNTTLVGSGYGSVIKAAPLLDTIIISSRKDAAPFNSNIICRNFKIDGNRLNQTPLTQVTGIKMYSVQDLLIENCLLEEIEGHGIHLNNVGLAVTGQRFVNTVVRGVGSSPTGTYGSCFAVTSGTDVIFDSCHAYDSYKAGFRLSGSGFVLNGCIAKYNGNGGIVPVSGECTGLTVNGGEFSDNTPDSDWPCDGIRLVGVDRVVLNGVTCIGNADCGVSIQNGCTDIEINGGQIWNNGVSVIAAGALQKRSGIAIWDNANGCTGIKINNVTLKDDQVSATQDYGIEIANAATDVLIDGCIFSGNELGPLNLAQLDTGFTVRVGNRNIGLSLPASTTDGDAVTGTTATTDLFTATINGNELGKRGVVKFRANGTFSGANGTKIMSVTAGGSALTFTATAVGAIASWRIDGEFTATSTSSVRASATLSYGSVTETLYQVLTVDTTASWTSKIRGKLSNSADTIDCQAVEYSRER